MGRVTAYAYIRVSTERQATPDRTSLADQREAIERKAADLGVQVDRWFEDAGASGATVEGRPAFSALVAACLGDPRRDGSGVLLFYDDTRFGRFDDPDQAAHLRFVLKRAGWIVRFVVGDDTEDVSFRHILRAIGGAQSSEERAKIRRRARTGKRGSALQGFWTGRAPIGYRRQVVYPAGSERVLEDYQHKASAERVKLVVHAEEAALVRWTFEQYGGGLASLQALARALSVRFPSRRWSKTVVQHLLRNPAYVGDVVGGKRPADRGERLLMPVRPAAEWYRCPDAHEPIVSRALFDAVQQRLANNRKLGRGVRANYLLTGILRCVYCAGHYAGGGNGGSVRARGGRKPVKFYREAAPHACPGRIGTVSRHLVDDAALGAIAKLVRQPAMAARITAEIDRQLERPAAVGPAQQLGRRRAQLVAQRDRLVDAIASGTLAQAEAGAKLQRIREELERVDADAQRARFEARRGTGPVDRDRLVALALDFPRAVERLRGPALRELVTDWLAGATFDKARRQLVLQIRPLPGVVLAGLPGQDGPDKARLIRRRLSLVPPGYDVERAVAELERARRRA